MACSCSQFCRHRSLAAVRRRADDDADEALIDVDVGLPGLRRLGGVGLKGHPADRRRLRVGDVVVGLMGEHPLHLRRELVAIGDPKHGKVRGTHLREGDAARFWDAPLRERGRVAEVGADGVLEVLVHHAEPGNRCAERATDAPKALREGCRIRYHKRPAGARRHLIKQRSRHGRSRCGGVRPACRLALVRRAAAAPGCKQQKRTNADKCEGGDKAHDKT